MRKLKALIIGLLCLAAFAGCGGGLPSSKPELSSAVSTGVEARAAATMHVAGSPPHSNTEYTFQGFLFTCDGGTVAGIYTGSDHLTVVGSAEFPNYIDSATAKFVSLNGAWTEHFHDMLNVTQVGQQHIVDANHTTVFYLGHLQQRYQAVIHVQKNANGSITTEHVETRCYGP